MTITYDSIDDVKKMQVADILSKRESIDGALADVQTERAAAEIAWKAKEQSLKAEQNKLTEELRNMRTATMTETGK